MFGDGDQGEEDEHREPKRANRRLFYPHGREPEGDVDDSLQARATEMDVVTQTQAVEDFIVPAPRESVARSLPSQALRSHFARAFEEDSNKGVLRVMQELRAGLEKQLGIVKKESLGAIKDMSFCVSTLERTLSRCQDAVKIVLLYFALPKKGKAA